MRQEVRKGGEGFVIEAAHGLRHGGLRSDSFAGAIILEGLDRISLVLTG